MKLLLGLLLATVIFAADKPTAPPAPRKIAITNDSEKLLVVDSEIAFKRLANTRQEKITDADQTDLGKKRAAIQKQINDLSVQLTSLNEQIGKTPLGKEISDIEAKLQKIRDKFVADTAPMLKAHDCVGGFVDPDTLEMTCPVTGTK